MEESSGEESVGGNVHRKTPPQGGNASSTKKRRAQYCTFCKNHKKEAPKKGHLCPYKACDCPLCELLRKAQITMRHQQRVWRHQKHKLQHSYSKFQDLTNVIDEKGQVCDKCRNHNELILKKNHQCPYRSCTCQYCSLTFKRRELMKHLQRVRRSKLTTELISETSEKTSEEKQIDPHQFNEEIETNETKNPRSPPAVETCEDQNSITGPSINDNSSHSSLKDSSTLLREVNEFQDGSVFSPPPLIPQTGSPPPLVPLSSGHLVLPHHLSREDDHSEALQKNYFESLPNRYDRDCGSPPSLYPLYEEEETVLVASTRLLSQIERISPKRCRRPPFYSSSCVQHPVSLMNSSITVHKPLRFGVQPEDFHLRHCKWPQPPSQINSSSWNSSSSTLLLRQHQQHQETLSSPLVNKPNFEEGQFSSQISGNRLFLPYYMGLRHKNPTQMDFPQFSYVERNIRE